MLHALSNYMTKFKKFCIAGKFGGNNIWQKGMDEDFGQKSLANVMYKEIYIEVHIAVFTEMNVS